MKNILEQFFNIWFLEIIVLSAISTFDRVMYEDTNHFIGFIKNYGLWPFLIGSVIVLFCGVVLIVLEYSKNSEIKDILSNARSVS